MLIGLGLGLIVSLLTLFYYRHQVKLLGQQLKEMANLDQATNQLITQEIYSPEINYLVQAINHSLIKERELIRQIKHRDRQMQELMTNLSHDVRTPLTSLIGYIQMLETSQSPEDKDRYFRIIYQRLDKLNQLLDRLFLLMKLEDPAYVLDLEKLDLQEAFSQNLLVYYDQLVTAGFQVDFDLQEDPVWVKSNDYLIQALVDNLIKNILDHGKDYVSISLLKENVSCRLVISNYLAQEFQGDPHKLLDRFYQADSSRSKGNAGLGLSIIKSVVDRMGGQIDLDLKDGVIGIQMTFPLV